MVFFFFKGAESSPHLTECIFKKNCILSGINQNQTIQSQQEMDTEFSSDEEDDVLESITSNSDISLRETDQEVLRLLFYLAERCTSNQSYVHHGVACNCCGRSPIFGARFHCTEGCPDVDICYGCEASYRHSKFHTLIKIRIAIPLNFSPRISIDSRIPSTINSSIPKELPEHVVVMLTSELRGMKISVSDSCAL